MFILYSYLPIANCLSTGEHRGYKRTSDPLELQLQACASRSVWLLQTEWGSSTRAASVLLTTAPSLQPVSISLIEGTEQ